MLLSVFVRLYLVCWKLCWCQMEKLRALGINPNALKSELVCALSTLTMDVLLTVREDLLTEYKDNTLVTPGDELVSRRVTRTGKPLKEELAEDIWTLLRCLKQGTFVPCTLVKNGKRYMSSLETSRTSLLLTAHVSGTPLNIHLDDLPTTANPPNNASLSCVMKELN